MGVLTALALAVPSAAASAAEPSPATGSTEVSPTADGLQRPARGETAIRLLGDQLDETATASGMTPGALRSMLRTDKTAWVDEDGRVLFKEPELAAGASAAPVAAEAAAPLSTTFTLHSNPGSTRTIFIDFDGAVVSGTAWNSSYNVSTSAQPAWSLDGDASTFSDTELTAIQSIWQRVSEDYAPFDVDVTTQDPGTAALVRSSTADRIYGARALVTPSTAAATSICNNTCGGVAYINVFGEVGATHQPAWIFSQNLGNDTKNIAEAVSHEVGHTFGLHHDGNDSQGYDAGHAMWAPIMGVGYNRPVAQWSRGEYTAANNAAEDDVALIAAKAPYRTDEAGSTLTTATPTVPTTAFVTTREDQDIYSLGVCSGTLTFAASPAAVSPDLDIRLDLLDSGGTVVTSADPTSAFVGRDSASGMAASISTSVTTGAYYVRVDGVGNGDGVTGYTDYASIGAYTLTKSGTCTPGVGVPGAPRSLKLGAEPDGDSVLTWAAPADTGVGPVTSYSVYVDGAIVSSGAGTSATFSNLVLGSTHDFAVTATNTAGTGPQARTSAKIAALPSTPSGLQVSPAADGQSATLTWSAPASDGGAALVGYRLTRTDGTPVDAGVGTSYTWTGLTPGATYGFTVAATNTAGTGASTETAATLPGIVRAASPAAQAPSAPKLRKAVSGARGGKATAAVSWTAPVGGLPLVGYRVLVFKVNAAGKVMKTTTVSFKLGAGATKYTAKLRKGTYRFAVVALFVDGASKQSKLSKKVMSQ